MFLTFWTAAEDLYPETHHAGVVAEGDDPDPGGDDPRPQQRLHLAVGVPVGRRLLHRGHPAPVLAPDLKN